MFTYFSEGYIIFVPQAYAAQGVKTVIDKEKIVLLTRLAIYDKYMSESDKKINNYFLHDYIYKKNFATRAFAFIGSLIIVFFYLLHKVFVMGADIFELDYRQELIDIAIFVVVVLVLYTIIGSFKSAMEYKASQNRIKAYIEVLKKATADEEEQKAERPARRTRKDSKEDSLLEEHDGYNESDIVYTGNNN